MKINELPNDVSPVQFTTVACGDVFVYFGQFYMVTSYGYAANLETGTVAGFQDNDLVYLRPNAVLYPSGI